eukprot:TRINITY_DN1940_c0_g2_i1.p1 TRINITY_DN1940_c0_g2~~TRINITY_DN1940_c0_g2_i1.p1  ORF type:complete len:186 (+),score=58.14 TRINITY_DN1940_c0_g2_i1:49-606(+)
MVSFSCNQCGDIIKKPKVKTHQQQCWTSGFSCVDCNGVFDTATVNDHKECVSETQRYAGKWLEKQAKSKGKPDPSKAVKRKRSPVKEMSSPEWTPENKPKESPKIEKKEKKEKKTKKQKKEEPSPKDTPHEVTLKIGKAKITTTVLKTKFSSAKEDERAALLKEAISAAVEQNIAKISEAVASSL